MTFLSDYIVIRILISNEFHVLETQDSSHMVYDSTTS